MSGPRRIASLVEALDPPGPPALIAIVGGGGKSSLMFALARELPGRAVMTTTTRIFAAQLELADAVCAADDPQLGAHLDARDESLIVVGRVEGERAVGVPPELPAALLARPSVDWVLVEADGSRMRPAKAPAEHEPVIPAGTNLLVVVAGIDALSAPIAERTHRPERVAELTQLRPEQPLTPRALATLLTSPRGGLKRAPATARVALLLNKVESEAERANAREVAGAALDTPGVDRVLSGALRGGPGPDWEVWTA